MSSINKNVNSHALLTEPPLLQLDHSGRVVNDTLDAKDK
jgi:hypothetical protein